MLVNHNHYRKFDYINNPSKKDEFILGEVVYKDGEIGVIIQCHGNDEYRTDMFGNCFYSRNSNYRGGISLATKEQIKKYRPELLG